MLCTNCMKNDGYRDTGLCSECLRSKAKSRCTCYWSPMRFNREIVVPDPTCPLHGTPPHPNVEMISEPIILEKQE